MKFLEKFTKCLKKEWLPTTVLMTATILGILLPALDQISLSEIMTFVVVINVCFFGIAWCWEERRRESDQFFNAVVPLVALSWGLMGGAILRSVVVDICRSFAIGSNLRHVAFAALGLCLFLGIFLAWRRHWNRTLAILRATRAIP